MQVSRTAIQNKKKMLVQVLRFKQQTYEEWLYQQMCQEVEDSQALILGHLSSQPSVMDNERKENVNHG